MIDRSGNKTKAIWSVVNRNLRHRKQSGSIGLNIDGEVISDYKEVTDCFVSYFSYVTHKELDDKFGDDKSSQCTLPLLSVSQSFFYSYVDCHEIIFHITNLKNKSSAGSDNIPVKVLRVIKDHIAEPLTFLINLAFKTGVFPDELKVGRIVPVFKKKDPTRTNNYRPITILNVLSKVFERVLYERIVRFLNENSIFSPLQFGFRMGRSTEGAACLLIGKVLEDLDCGNCVAGLFFDLSRAFDSLEIKFIIDKLYAN